MGIGRREPHADCRLSPDWETAVAAFLAASESTARAGYFEPRAVRRLVEKCRNPLGLVSAGDNMAFIGILSTQLLHSCYVQPLI